MTRSDVLKPWIATCAMLFAASSAVAKDSPSLTAAYELGFRTTFRSSAIQGCLDTTKAATARGFNATAICTCIADTLMATKSVAELSKPIAHEEMVAIAARCVRNNPPVAGKSPS
jgi:hypothetical protein